MGELRALVAEHPWRERFRAQLMLALYRAGHQADALGAFRAARAALVEHLGVEPGADLQALHQAILAQDPALATTGRLRGPAGGAAYLALRDGAGNEVRYSLTTAPDRVAIGRRASNDVVLQSDEKVSRVHAELKRIGDVWTVADDGLSQNGTYVGDVRVAGGRRLQDGDVIRCGGTRIVFCDPAQEGSRPTTPRHGHGREPPASDLSTPAASSKPGQGRGGS